jgi:hypothetical protein
MTGAFHKAHHAWRRFRSAITGLFVSKQFADEHPESTVGEAVNDQ